MSRSIGVWRRPAPPGGGGPGRHRWRVLLAVLAGIVVAAVVGCAALQRRLVYPATHYDHAEFERRVRRDFGPRAAILAPYDAIVVEPAGKAASTAHGTAIYFHGNGSVNTELAELLPVFEQRGLRLVLPEFPGYGARPGIPSEQALLDDARALHAAIAARYPDQPIVVLGQSLGSGVAVQVAAAAEPNRPAARLVLITPFASLPDAAANALWGLPVQSLFSERYDSATALKRYRGPVAFLIAARDQVIGAKQGLRLAGTPRPHGESIEIVLSEADHDSWFAHTTAEQWDRLLGVPGTAP